MWVPAYSIWVLVGIAGGFCVGCVLAVRCVTMNVSDRCLFLFA